MEEIQNQKYSRLGGRMKVKKYSRLDGRDGRLEILKVRWNE